jgi:hypothetical protein
MDIIFKVLVTIDTNPIWSLIFRHVDGEENGLGGCDEVGV